MEVPKPHHNPWLPSSACLVAFPSSSGLHLIAGRSGAIFTDEPQGAWSHFLQPLSPATRLWLICWMVVTDTHPLLSPPQCPIHSCPRYKPGWSVTQPPHRPFRFQKAGQCFCRLCIWSSGLCRSHLRGPAYRQLALDILQLCAPSHSPSQRPHPSLRTCCHPPEPPGKVTLNTT